jgi:TPR repeat protein
MRPLLLVSLFLLLIAGAWGGWTWRERAAAGRADLACRGGDPDACAEIARRLRSGRGVKKDDGRAAELESAVAPMRGCRGETPADCALVAVLYDPGHALADDAHRAAALRTNACAGGSVTGCLAFADMQVAGRGMAADASAAGEGLATIGRYWQKNLQAGAPDLLSRACDLKAKGACVDAAESLPLPPAPNVLGVLSAGPQIQSLTAAIIAELGNAAPSSVALDKRGRSSLLDGIPSPQLAPGAAPLLTKGCNDQNDRAACGMLATMNHDHDADPWYARLAQLDAASCDAGDGRACFRIALVDVPPVDEALRAKSQERALPLLEAACEKNDRSACHDLLTAAGLDKPRSLSALEAACTAGAADACENAYFASLGSPVSKVEGARIRAGLERGVSLRMETCKQGTRDDCFKVGQFYATYLFGSTTDSKRSIEWFRRGCDLDDRTSCCWLANEMDSSDPKAAEPYWQKGGGRSTCFPVMQ